MPFEINHVSVTIHEKKAHPHQHGHFDAEVTISSQGFASSPDQAGAALLQLRALARDHVREEIQDWLADVQADKRQDDLLAELEGMLAHNKHYIRDTQRQLDPEYIGLPYVTPEHVTLNNNAIRALKDRLARLSSNRATLVRQQVDETIMSLHSINHDIEQYLADHEPEEEPNPED